MTAEGRGAYIALLCHAWESDGVPDDPRVLAALTGANKLAIGEAKAKFYKADDGKLRNKRQEDTRAKLKDYRANQATKARKSWAKRKAQPEATHTQSHRLTTGEPMPYQSQSQSQSKKPNPKPNNNGEILTKETAREKNLPSPWEIKIALDAVTTKLDANRNHHRGECAGGAYQWDNPDAEALDRKLRNRKHQLNSALAGVD